MQNPMICRFNFAIKPAKQIGMCLKFAVQNTTLWSLVSASLCCYLCLFLFLFLCSFHLTLGGILKDTFVFWSPSRDIPERSSHQHDLGWFGMFYHGSFNETEIFIYHLYIRNVFGIYKWYINVDHFKWIQPTQNRWNPVDTPLHSRSHWA